MLANSSCVSRRMCCASSMTHRFSKMNWRHLLHAALAAGLAFLTALTAWTACSGVGSSSMLPVIGVAASFSVSLVAPAVTNIAASSASRLRLCVSCSFLVFSSSCRFSSSFILASRIASIRCDICSTNFSPSSRMRSANDPHLGNSDDSVASASFLSSSKFSSVAVLRRCSAFLATSAACCSTRRRSSSSRFLCISSVRCRCISSWRRRCSKLYAS
mmetsp:Transcript_7841/g.21535  ORF Transcript_7841/g.21535 Transcript_7841/m.21535 type:complete len:216 (-) Transcript_7841:946-1593(-)